MFIEVCCKNGGKYFIDSRKVKVFRVEHEYSSRYDSYTFYADDIPIFCTEKSEIADYEYNKLTASILGMKDNEVYAMPQDY